MLNASRLSMHVPMLDADGCELVNCVECSLDEDAGGYLLIHCDECSLGENAGGYL